MSERISAEFADYTELNYLPDTLAVQSSSFSLPYTRSLKAEL